MELAHLNHFVTWIVYVSACQCGIEISRRFCVNELNLIHHCGSN
jgi:hypothetical protein